MSCNKIDKYIIELDDAIVNIMNDYKYISIQNFPISIRMSNLTLHPISFNSKNNETNESWGHFIIS